MRAGASGAGEEGDGADSKAGVGNYSSAAGSLAMFPQCVPNTQILEASLANLLPVRDLVLAILILECFECYLAARDHLCAAHRAAVCQVHQDEAASEEDEFS